MRIVRDITSPPESDCDLTQTSAAKPDLVVAFAPVIELDLPSLPEHVVALLSKAEQARAFNLQSQGNHHEFVCGRLLLRRMLARITGTAPASLDICIDRRGKPYLNGGNTNFSLSHAAGYVCVAISASYRVGVDIECPALFDDTLVSGHLLQKRLMTPPAAQAETASHELIELWCMCEAYAKCFAKDVLASMRTIMNFKRLTNTLPQWHAGADFSFFLTTVAAGRVPLVLCVDSAPVSVQVVEMDLLQCFPEQT